MEGHEAHGSPVTIPPTTLRAPEGRFLEVGSGATKLRWMDSVLIQGFIRTLLSLRNKGGMIKASDARRGK